MSNDKYNTADADRQANSLVDAAQEKAPSVVN
jgi:hypothetical protein